MDKNEKLALVTLMQEVQDQRALQALADKIFDKVVPLHRKAHDDVVFAAVTLLAAGTPVYRAVDALHTTGKINQDKTWVENLVNRVVDVVREKAKSLESPEMDLNVALKAAMSYAAVIDGRGNPSPELEQLAQGGDYNRAGIEAMMQVMRFLSAPTQFGLTPDTVRLSENLVEHVHNAARNALPRDLPREYELTSVQVDDDDVVTATVENGMAFKEDVHDIVIYSPQNVPAAENDVEGMTL